ncbi:Alpha/Beta hydrolase protein [Immersiella caudata]|uniref:Alpha/Beta hydrolase protein n=1 Tax=Immersiella caudata TaxID=314043 RepID=A0AA40CBP5_9PEZI|nr:Alpha/Beta hydrolase protein [Immersiella caudata]
MACADCFTGTLRGDLTPSGHETTIHSLPTYIASPPDGITPLGIVVILSDAFGYQLLNTRVLADAYARRVPCTVYVPDFMAGHSPPTSFMTRSEYVPPEADFFPVKMAKRAGRMLATVPALGSFLVRNRESVVTPRVQAFMKAVRSSEDPEHPGEGKVPRVGIAGFCWGGGYTVRLTHDREENKVVCADGVERHVVDCAFTAHPTWVDIPADVEAVMRPLSVANGEDDKWMGTEKWEKLKGILARKNEEAGEEVHESVEYKGAKHGFAVRGDRGDPLQRERGERSEDQAVEWFRRYFRV